MGNLFRLLSKSSNEDVIINLIDFEDSVPNEEEEDLYNKMNTIIVILDECTEIINKWITKLENSQIQNMDDSLIKKSNFFLKLKDLFNDIKMNFPILLEKLFQNCDKVGVAEGSFFNSQALSKIYVKFLNACLNTDISKLSNSNVCNDLSLIRRSNKYHPDLHDKLGLTVSDVGDLTISLAHRDTMLREVICLTKAFLEKDNIDAKHASKILLSMAKVCKNMCSNSEIYSKLKNADSRIFILNVMVTLLVMADQIHPDGLLHDSSFDYESYLKLVNQFPEKSNHLIKVLRFQSKTGNSPSIKSSVKNLYT